MRFEDYVVTKRTHEIGIRIALGAPSRRILALIVGRAMTLAAIGMIAGTAAALALTQFLASLLFEVSPSDPQTFAAVAVLVGRSPCLRATCPRVAP